MTSETTTVNAADGIALHTYRWEPETPAKAVVQIAHGMAEHAGRYARFAAALNDAGYAVYAEDHRGHGQTNPVGSGHGYFADEDGFDTVVEDLYAVSERIRQDHPTLPLFLLGHSMGSFLSRAYAARHGDDLAGLILSGTAGDQGLLGKAGAAIVALEIKVRGRTVRSPLMNTLTFGQYNRAFAPRRTEFDWLSRDPAEVDAYVADPLCGNVFTTGFFADLLAGLDGINNRATIAKVPTSLPIQLIAGSLDPVGAGGKGVLQVAEQYRAAGVEDVSLHLYIGARHEVLNETNRDEVTADVIAWLDNHLQ